ncbi:MAG: hypothetical protein PHV02_13755 [Rhodocyclaceae bacterium]|nr:hypothetical protein [Rhodocyclaceae bacterium]
MTKKQFKFAIDSAPGKHLIEQLAVETTQVGLRQFFDVRMTWCGGYPLVHDYLVTYGAFDDLMRIVSIEKRIDLIPLMLNIIVSVSDDSFHAALFLLVDLIPDDRMLPRPSGFNESFLLLRLRAERLGFLANLSCAWDTFARKQRLLFDADDPLRRYSAKQLQLDTNRWKDFFPFPLLNFTKGAMRGCNVSFATLRREIGKLGANPGARRLIYATTIDDVRYWVWEIPGFTDIAHLTRVIYLRVPLEGTGGLGYWDLYRQFHERVSAESISKRLLNIEFSQRMLTPMAQI